MTDFMPDLVSYHAVSPDPEIPGCRNTGLEEDGVVFHGVEPLIGTDTFLGRTTMIEGIAVLYGMDPARVDAVLKADLEPETPVKKPRKKNAAPEVS